MNIFSDPLPSIKFFFHDPVVEECGLEKRSN